MYAESPSGGLHSVIREEKHTQKDEETNGRHKLLSTCKLYREMLK